MVWFAFHGAGVLVHQNILHNKLKSRIPVLVTGILVYVTLTLILSIFGFLDRNVLRFLIMIPAVYGILVLYRDRKPYNFKPDLPFWLIIPVSLILFILILSSVLHSVIPHGMVDPLITYAVQPDRWLDAGGMYFLSETKFSFFPLAGEMISVWPASLAVGRLDQLIMLQLFQMSMLMGSFIIAARALRLKPIGYLLALIVCAATSILVQWGAWAKTDMTALFLLSAALAEIIRVWLMDDEKRISMLTWFLLGLSAATKFTAVFALAAILPFLLFFCVRKGKLNRTLPGIGLLISIPMIFILRNYFMTGEPFYPFHLPGFIANDIWALESIPCLIAVKSHGHASLLVNLIELFRSWNLPGLLFLSGSVYAICRKSSKAVYILYSAALYGVISCIVFDPVEWGAKYAIFLLPVMAVTGLYLLREKMKYCTAILLSIVIFTSSIIGRTEFIYSFITDSEPLQFEGMDYPPSLPLQLWMNENLPEGSRILSMWRPERYFSDHEIFVAQNHPDGIELFLDNSLEEELEILDRMDVQYIYFLMDDPLPENLEEHVELLNAIGPDECIRPVISVSGSLLCEYCN